MSMFQSSNNVSIHGGMQVAVTVGRGSTITIAQEGKRTSAFKDLSEAAAHTALHNSSARYDAPRCHRNTRAKQLDLLELWILGKSEEFAQTRLMWLSGGAGAGKSAIMQSIIERCLPHEAVLGSFFFSRSDTSRNTAEHLIPTLAYQVARTYPAAMTILEAIITRDPLIFKASLETQADELLVRPFLFLMETGAISNGDGPLGVFVIDGLDECDNPWKQALVIQTISSILRKLSVPLFFLIASRPEVSIQEQFYRQFLGESYFSTLLLDNDDDARADIRQYIEDCFLDIIEHHPMKEHISLSWPSRETVDLLVSISSGHFIYAATAMNYIASHDEHPERALKVIQELVPARIGNPFARLDALYIHVLTSAKYPAQVLNILRHLAFIYLPLNWNLTTFCWVHGISPAEVELFTSDVRSLLQVSTGELAQLSLKHASLMDFLLSPSRAQQLFMSYYEYHAKLLKRLLHLLAHSDTFYPRWFLEEGEGFPTNIEDGLIISLGEAIRASDDPNLGEILIQHSPTLVWRHMQAWADPNLVMLSYSVANYMGAIRDSYVADRENGPYVRHFRTYMQIFLDNLDPNKEDNEYPLGRPRSDDKRHWLTYDTAQQISYDRALSDLPADNNAIIPALVFSSTRSTLRLAHHILFRFANDFAVSPCYASYLSHLVRPTHLPINPLTMNALRSLPESQKSRGPGLSMAMRLVLETLSKQAWTPPFYFNNGHEQWIKRNKPWKHISIGSPRFAQRFYDYDRGRLTSRYNYDLPYDYDSSNNIYSERYKNNKGRYMFKEGCDCILLLRAIIPFLRKADCTLEVARLARKSLPAVARWFPSLMKKARREMDAYVLRWEGSLGGLLEKAQSLEINDLN